jgi:hypothetical protein
VSSFWKARRVFLAKARRPPEPVIDVKTLHAKIVVLTLE